MTLQPSRSGGTAHTIHACGDAGVHAAALRPVVSEDGAHSRSSWQRWVMLANDWYRSARLLDSRHHLSVCPVVRRETASTLDHLVFTASPGCILCLTRVVSLIVAPKHAHSNRAAR